MEELVEKYNISKEDQQLLEENFNLNQTKPIISEDKTTFEEYANELLALMPSFKKLDARVKILNETCKKYMLDNNIKVHECKNGDLMLRSGSYHVLNRLLIPDIEIYKEDVIRHMLFKNTKI